MILWFRFRVKESEDVREVLEELGIKNSTADDIAVVRHVCRLVSNRSALLVSICLAALLDRIDREEATVAVDGSLFGKHPRYRSLTERYVELFTQKKVLTVNKNNNNHNNNEKK